MRLSMEVNELLQLNWIYITDLLQLLLLQQQSRVQWAEESRESAPNLRVVLWFSSTGIMGKNPICPLISSGQGLRTSRYTRARSKMEEIPCDSGTDFPERLQTHHDR